MILPKSDKCVIPEIFSRGSMDSRFKRAGMTNLNYQRGVSLLELILVIVIMAIGAALVIPRLEQGVENRRAKDALETLKTISNAVRLYELNTGSFPPSGLLDQEDAIPPGPPHVLESGGYLNPKEYAPSFNYSINSAATPVITATHTGSGRTITLTQSAVVKGQDCAIADTAGFLNTNPNYPAVAIPC